MYIAAIQMISGSNLDRNLLQAEHLIALAVSANAKLIVLPENFSFMPKNDGERLSVQEEFGQGKIQDFLSKQSKLHQVFIIAGTVPISDKKSNKVFGSCLVYNDQGICYERYDKIHLFDVNVPEINENYNESETIQAGNEVKVIETPFAKIGLAVCYDLRFPELFRQFVDLDVDIIAIPSAFTEMTGKAHWEVLLKARAIENLSYVIAANQGGKHESNRETYGDSMIVDPWGNILNRLAKGPGIVLADIDKNKLSQLRSSFPVLKHRQL